MYIRIYAVYCMHIFRLYVAKIACNFEFHFAFLPFPPIVTL